MPSVSISSKVVTTAAVSVSALSLSLLSLLPLSPFPPQPERANAITMIIVKRTVNFLFITLHVLSENTQLV